MKGALTPTNQYQFDENGALVANEGESEESRSTRESIVLYVEGHSGNHPADVASSNGAEDIPPEALAVGGTRVLSEKAEANDSNDPAYEEPTTQDEVEEEVLAEEDEEASSRSGRRGRRGR